jgi:hypothetical protein
MADWGLTEVAVVRLLPDSDELRKYQGTGRVHHMTILWESDRRIDAIFGDLQVNESG